MKKRILSIIFITTIMGLGLTACGGGGGKVINSATELKEYLDRQPANSPDKPIKVSMSVTNMMLNDVGNAIRDAGKYVSLDLSRSTGLTEIGDRVFRDCTGLTSITIPESVTKIGDDSFLGCVNLISFNVIGSDDNSIINGTWVTNYDWGFYTSTYTHIFNSGLVEYFVDYDGVFKGHYFLKDGKIYFIYVDYDTKFYEHQFDFSINGNILTLSGWQYTKQ